MYRLGARRGRRRAPSPRHTSRVRGSKERRSRPLPACGLESGGWERSTFDPRRKRAAKKRISTQISVVKKRTIPSSKRNSESTRSALDDACSGNSGKFHMMHLSSRVRTRNRRRFDATRLQLAWRRFPRAASPLTAKHQEDKHP